MRKAPARKLARGFTLIEILVAIVVLSIGLLGIAGLQLATTKYKINSWSRSSNASLFADFSDRVRMNPSQAGRNYITGADSTSAYILNSDWATQQAATDASLTITPNCETDSSVTSCTPQQRAAYDMGAWRLRVRNALPQGAALVEGNRSDGITVTLMWFDKENTDSQRRINDGTAVNLVAVTTCTSQQTGLARQTCCPATASAPAGVRCARFSFVP
ncbi:type IV pilus modification protein PilV [Variovorax sp. HJSM1_2]|uniref:type IV pilus modification protein PilV n=1 Tax=Variovorax sp. HJSM1_2 TaxID=3366263 RepID=UPI003BE8F349